MRNLQLAHMNDIMQRVHASGLSKLEIAALAPLVIEAAHAGDATAKEILYRGIQHLASCVEAVARRLSFDGAVELAVVGGLFNAGEIVFEALRVAVQNRLPLCQMRSAELSPVSGACLIALSQIGVAPDQEIMVQLRKHSEQILASQPVK
jgi:N-acetylglucosamine kinase-like BadF-type ATPase